LLIDDILETISSLHETVPVRSKDRMSEIADFENLWGHKLPADMKKFYERFEEALLFDHYKIMSFDGANSYREGLYEPGAIPESWVVFTDCGIHSTVQLVP